jgi:hypothetical protein
VKHRTTSRGSDDDEFTVREVEYKLWDKPKSLQLVMQHLGMLIMKHQHSGKVTLEEMLREVEGDGDRK